MKVIHAPESARNPYQELLFAGLGAVGVQVRSIPFSDLYGWFPLTRHGITAENIIHLHWVHAFYQTPSLFRSVVKALVLALELWRLRRRGLKVVWTVHDRVSHDCSHPWLDRQVRKGLARFSDRVIVHCAAARSWVIQEWGVSPERIAVIPHGSFRGYYPDQVSRAQARAELGLEAAAKVFLVFGSLRADKGIEELLAVWARWPQPELRLLVAGWVWEPKVVVELERAAARDPRIRIFAHFIPEERVQYFMRAADVVVLPYRETLTSGVLALALDFSRAVVAPAVGCIPEQLGPEGGLLYDPEDPQGLEKTLRAVLTMDTEALGQKNGQRSELLHWDGIAQTLRDLYLELLERER